MARILDRLQHIDRRILYVLVVLVVGAPFMFRMSLPIYPTKPVIGAYNAVENVAKLNQEKHENRIVLLVVNWEPGTRGETGPQTTALIQHMFRHNIRFAIFSHNTPIGQSLGQQIAMDNAPRWHKKYGVDWVNWGYRPGQIPMIQGLARDIRSIIGKDAYGTPLDKIPMMKGIRNFKDNVGLIVDVSPAWTVGLWIQYVQGRYGTPIVFSPTAVMIAETYPYLASGQFKGTLPGLRGAAEYEKLNGIPGYATRAMNAQSMAHLLIMFLIVIGNVGYLASRRQKGAGQ